MNSATKSEVIDLENSNIVCKDLDDFPMGISDAVGANLASMPIICGGVFNNGSYHSADKCFRYVKGEWQHFVTMIDRRRYAAGIVYYNALHIFGGYDSDENARLQSSEIVNEDGTSTEGPQLPEWIYRHAIASINSTVSIISGGYTNAYSGQTWYFNHATQKFQLGPNLLEKRYGHSSGTITDQETGEKIVIVAGGSNNIISLMDSTEILLNGKWITGNFHMKNINFLHVLYFLTVAS